jgi:hypothetical protein
LRIPEEFLQGGDGIANGFGFLAADLYTGPAGYAPLGHHFGLALFHFDGFGRAFAHAGIAPAAFFLYGGDYGHGNARPGSDSSLEIILHRPKESVTFFL